MLRKKEYDILIRNQNIREGRAMERIVKENYYLDIAETVLERSTCLRRQYGAIIVRNDEIVATGYNGAPRGRKNCSDLGYCVREQMRVPCGKRMADESSDAAAVPAWTTSILHGAGGLFRPGFWT